MHIGRYELLAGILHLRLQLQYTQFEDHSKLWQRDTYLEIAAFPSISSGSDCFRGKKGSRRHSATREQDCRLAKYQSRVFEEEKDVSRIRWV